MRFKMSIILMFVLFVTSLAIFLAYHFRRPRADRIISRARSRADKIIVRARSRADRIIAGKVEAD